MVILVSVVGAAYRNLDGRCRRTEIACCMRGEPVRLVPEPDNAADPNAIAVFSVRDVQIGYVRARLTGRVRRQLALGRSAAVFVRRSIAGAEVSLCPGPLQSSAEPSWIGFYG